jgi:hypothetical protein
MQGVSTIKYYRNTTIPRHITCLPSYRHTAFPTQIFRKLLKHLLAYITGTVDQELLLRG